MTRFFGRQKPGYPRGPDGKPVCRWCEGPLPKGRRSFCSQRCVDEFVVRSDGNSVRRLVHARDHGVCAHCGIDCDALEKLVRRLNRSKDPVDRAKIGPLGRELRARGFVVRLRDDGQYIGLHTSLWDADHIVPVIEGGGVCGLANLRTLCKPCHRNETRALARRRADQRRGRTPLDLNRNGGDDDETQDDQHKTAQ